MNKKNRKKIGIIGGVGPQASELLYHRIIKIAAEKYGAKNNDDYPCLLLYSVPVPDFISSKEKMNDALLEFNDVIKDLEKVEVNQIAIASNTVNLLLEEFQKVTTIPFISVIDAVIDRITSDNRKIVGLLASPLTMKSSLYEKPLGQKGVRLIIPESKDFVTIESIIRATIAGQPINNLKDNYIKILQTLFDRGAEAVILGCTELPLTINYEAIQGKIYDSEAILAEKITDSYYQA